MELPYSISEEGYGRPPLSLAFLKPKALALKSAGSLVNSFSAFSLVIVIDGIVIVWANYLTHIE